MSHTSRAVIGLSTRTLDGAQSGFALSEALVATLLLTSGLLAMAQLIDIAVSTNSGAKETTMTAILADQKIEQLRALTWGWDAAGQPLADLSTDTARFPESPGGGTGLQTSPTDALHRSTSGFVDHVDAFGSIVGNDARAPPQAVFTRRWSVALLPLDSNAIVIRVRVTPTHHDRDGNVRARVPGETHAVTIKMRKSR